jgi:hypothetical protein
MWQIICVCLSTLTTGEQHRFFHLLCGTEHTSAEERGAVDLSLLFLHALSAEEALTVLEERRDLVIRAQTLIAQQQAHEHGGSDTQSISQDHLQALLEAELAWLDRTVRRLRIRGQNPSSEGEKI